MSSPNSATFVVLIILVSVFNLVTVTFLQVMIYSKTFPQDARRLKAATHLPSILDACRTLDFLITLIVTLNSCVTTLITSASAANHRIDKLQSLSAPTLSDSLLALLSAAAILCQVLFLHRAWTFSMRKRSAAVAVTGYLAAACVSTVIVDSAMSVMGGAPVRGAGHMRAGFALEAAGHISAALLMCWELKRGRSTSDRTSVVSTQRTIAAELIGSLFSLGCLTAGMHYVLGRLYSNALLATLNARARLGPTDNSDPQGANSIADGAL
ncbi:hypothetical protein DFH09DRAFT_1187713 [Mycena vulgaris]|nr:hypothetical protein DFH09DRAFT_1187713 [Mycena vulgaris]